jgi:hypothetical protein
LVFVLGFYFSACKKDKYKNLEHGVTILNILPDTAYINEKIHVRFSVLQEGLDSVVCNINDFTYSLEDAMEYRTFDFTLSVPGDYVFYLEAFYKDGVSAQTEKKNITFIDYPIPPPEYPNITFECENSAGYKYSYINDSIDITVVEREGEHVLDGYVRAVLYFNGDSITYTEEKPFIFKNLEITREHNTIKIYFIDTIGRRISKTEGFITEYNTPPRITRFELNWNDGNYYFSFQEPEFHLAITDNKCIHMVQIFKDDVLIIADSSYDYHYYNDYFEVGPENPGPHSAYVVACDERGDSVDSVLHYQVFKSVLIDDKINEVENDKDEDLIFAISNYRLYIIDPSMETVNYVILQYSHPLAMDYVAQNNRLYFGCRNGKVNYYDLSTEEFYTVLNGDQEVDDIEIDYDLNKAVLIRNRKVELVDLNTLESIEGEGLLEENSTLMLDRINKKIIIAGYTLDSPERVYKYGYGNSSISFELTKKYENFDSRIFPGLDGSEFVLSGSAYNSESYSFNTDDLSIKGDFNYSITDCCYSNNGSELYAVYSGVGDVKVFSISSFEETASYDGLQYTSFIRPNIDDSKMILFTEQSMNKTMISFLHMD